MSRITKERIQRLIKKIFNDGLRDGDNGYAEAHEDIQMLREAENLRAQVEALEGQVEVLREQLAQCRALLRPSNA